VTEAGACLVTGATGFIGGHLTERLVAKGERVRCLVRARSDTTLLRALGVELAVGDLTDPDSLGRAMDGCTSVVHCGALVSDWARVAEIEAINVAGTRALLGAAATAPVRRFVHVSTTDVHATRSPNWYARTKRAAEDEVARARGLQTVVVRPATVYGPRSTEVVGEIARAIRGRHMVLIDRGRAIAGLVYVDNLVDALVLGLRNEAAPGQAFDVTDGLDVTWRRFTDDLARGLGCPPVRFSLPYPVAHGLGFALEHGYRALRRATGLTVAPLLSRQAVHVLGVDQDFSAARAREVLGWTPRVGYEAGLEATLAWLRAAG
jgi:nucleoside-diphosphate-sugar epimerase